MYTGHALCAPLIHQHGATAHALQDYDLKQIRTKLTTAVVSVLITGGIHYKWGMNHPLLIQSVLQPMNALGDPLAKIWLMGADDSSGSTKRPFAVEKPPCEFWAHTHPRARPPASALAAVQSTMFASARTSG